MRLDLKDIIHKPDARKTFQFQADLSGLEFYGRKPITRPVLAQGSVTNHAGALVAQALEDEENDEIILLDGTELDLDQVVTEAFVLEMDTKNLCSDDCKGLCAKCGADLNLGPCGCRPEVDPRLAALAQLLDGETE